MVPGTRTDAAGAAVGLASTLAVVALAGSVQYAPRTVLFVTGLAAGSVGVFLLSSGGTTEASTGVPGDGLSNTRPPARFGGRSTLVRALAVALLSLSLGCLLVVGVRTIA